MLRVDKEVIPKSLPQHRKGKRDIEISRNAFLGISFCVEGCKIHLAGFLHYESAFPRFFFVFLRFSSISRLPKVAKEECQAKKIWHPSFLQSAHSIYLLVSPTIKGKSKQEVG